MDWKKIEQAMDRAIAALENANEDGSVIADLMDAREELRAGYRAQQPGIEDFLQRASEEPDGISAVEYWRAHQEAMAPYTARAWLTKIVEMEQQDALAREKFAFDYQEDKAKLPPVIYDVVVRPK